MGAPSDRTSISLSLTGTRARYSLGWKTAQDDVCRAVHGAWRAVGRRCHHHRMPPIQDTAG
jgi:hypothetical protein